MFLVFILVSIEIDTIFSDIVFNFIKKYISGIFCKV